MKFLVFLAVAVACAAADVSHLVKEDVYVPIIKSSFVSSPDGNDFAYGYETGNGIVAETSGVVKNPNTDAATLVVRGVYKYTSPDGTPVETAWTADENGYQAQGSHIPVAPPVPEAIARAIAYIAAHPPAVEQTYKP